MSKVLGLDVSTKTIGVALFEDKGDYGDLKLLTHVTPKVKPKPDTQIEMLVKKAKIFEAEFLNKYKDMDIKRVIIEEPLLRSNNVNTVAILLRYNGMISRSVLDTLNIVPEFISSYDARKFGFPELMESRSKNKKGQLIPEHKRREPTLFGGYPHDVDKKTVIWDKVANMEPQITWLYTRNNTLKSENFDMTDAYAAVMGHMRKNELWV